MDSVAPLSDSITAVIYFGDVVFAISGALTAARYHMDVIGFVLIGTITGIGGGTTRDLLIGRPVWWTHDPYELALCVLASLITYLFYQRVSRRHSGTVWADALGLSACAVAGSHIALGVGVAPGVAVFMGMVTAVGGGLLRDIITNSKPMITEGQLYASAALLGSLCYVLMNKAGTDDVLAQGVAFSAAFGLRAAAVKFNIRMGPPGDFIRIGEPASKASKKESDGAQ
jgi:uncharacterized membrane protein YeiH